MRQKVTWGCIALVLLLLMIGGISFFTEEPYEIVYLDKSEDHILTDSYLTAWYAECKMMPDMVHRYPLRKETYYFGDDKEGYLLYYRHGKRDGNGFEFAIKSSDGILITDVKENNNPAADEIFAIVFFDEGTFELDPEPEIDTGWQHNEYVKELLLDLDTEPYEAEIQYLNDISDYPGVNETLEYWYAKYAGPSAFPAEGGYLLIDSDHRYKNKKLEVSLETSGSVLSIRTYPTDEHGDGRVLVYLPEVEKYFEMENIYLDGNRFSYYIVDETLQKATIGWTDWSFLLDAPEGALADEIVKEINFLFQPSPNSLHCIIRSTFNSPEELHFGSFLRYFPLTDQMSEEEKRALETSEIWIEERGIDDLPVPTKPYRADTVNKVLEYYLGLTIDELNEEGKEGYLYFPEYDTYYNHTSDWGPGMFTCTWGEKEGTQVKLYGESFADVEYGGLMDNIISCIVLEEEEGRYLFRSHTESFDNPIES